jgi:hypothetical protein
MHLSVRVMLQKTNSVSVPRLLATFVLYLAQYLVLFNLRQVCRVAPAPCRSRELNRLGIALSALLTLR